MGELYDLLKLSDFCQKLISENIHYEKCETFTDDRGDGARITLNDHITLTLLDKLNDDVIITNFNINAKTPAYSIIESFWSSIITTINMLDEYNLLLNEREKTKSLPF